MLGSGRLVVTAGFLILGIIFSMLFLFFSKRKSGPKKSTSSPEKQERIINYDDILTTIKKQNGRIHTLLLAANSLSDLPVTIPVNVAIRLAKTHKCLLIDLDIKRNAIARVFDIESTPTNGALKTGSCPTSVKNLYVWPARNFELLRQTNLRSLLEGAEKKYDFVLIYAPYLTTLPDRRQVASCAKQVIVFTGKDSSRLMQLLEQCNCKVLKEL